VYSSARAVDAPLAAIPTTDTMMAHRLLVPPTALIRTG
jgi:hypothetical protein